MDKCNSILGINLKEEEYNAIFKLLQITIKKDKKSFLCYVPSFRNDLEREVDIFEEIARVYGYDNIPSTDTLTSSFSAMSTDKKKVEALIEQL